KPVLINRLPIMIRQITSKTMVCFPGAGRGAAYSFSGDHIAGAYGESACVRSPKWIEDRIGFSIIQAAATSPSVPDPGRTDEVLIISGYAKTIVFGSGEGGPARAATQSQRRSHA